MLAQELLNTIKQRRSVFPAMYRNEAISREDLLMILEAGRWAPTHKKTEPWRFIIYHTEEARNNLGAYLGDRFEELYTGERYSAIKHKKTIKKPLQAGCVLAIILNRDPAEAVPEWEEVAAVSCAVQNMWLQASAMGIGAYWSSPSMITAGAESYLGLEANQRCLGLMYMGHWNPIELPANRKDLNEVVEWK